VDALLGLGDGKDFPLKKGLVLSRTGGFISIKEKTIPKLCYQYLWDGRGVLPVREIDARFRGKRIKKAKIRGYRFGDAARCYCDADKLDFPLLVRSRLDGDRYRPLGSPGRKKLKEILRAKRIPVRDRDKHPVFLSGGKIVWVLGLPVAEEFKLTVQTKIVFALSLL
jgi:tRNA(Ile)-lysidine synthase